MNSFVHEDEMHFVGSSLNVFFTYAYSCQPLQLALRNSAVEEKNGLPFTSTRWAHLTINKTIGFGVISLHYTVTLTRLWQSWYIALVLCKHGVFSRKGSVSLAHSPVPVCVRRMGLMVMVTARIGTQAGTQGK